MTLWWPSTVLRLADLPPPPDKPVATGLTLALLLALFALGSAGPALGAPEGLAGASAAGPPRCSNGIAPALAELSCEIARTLGALPTGIAIASAPVASEPSMATRPDLSSRIASSIASAVGRSARALPGALSLAEARKAAGDAKVLVLATPEIAHGELRVTAVVYPVTLGFWDRLRDVAVAPAARASALRHLDGEIGALLPRNLFAFAATRVERAAATADIVALACGDLAGGGGAELVAVGRHKLQVGISNGSRFSVRREANWSALSPVAPSPLREPIGAALIQTGAGVFVGLTDRANAVLLSPSLEKLEKLDASLPFGPGGCLSRSGIALGSAHPCKPSAAVSIDATAATDVDALASGSMVDASGKVIRVVAFRNARTREVTLRDDAGRTATAPISGAALALGELDLDGAPELVASVDTESPEADALVVSTWTHAGAILPRLRIPVKDGVHAITPCPAEALRMAPIVAATGNGLWIVH